MKKSLRFDSILEAIKEVDKDIKSLTESINLDVNEESDQRDVVLS